MPGSSQPCWRGRAAAGRSVIMTGPLRRALQPIARCGGSRCVGTRLRTLSGGLRPAASRPTPTTWPCDLSPLSLAIAISRRIRRARRAACVARALDLQRRVAGRKARSGRQVERKWCWQAGQMLALAAPSIEMRASARRAVLRPDGDHEPAVTFVFGLAEPGAPIGPARIPRDRAIREPRQP